MTARARLALAGVTAAALALRAWDLDRRVVDLHELFLIHAAGGGLLPWLRERPLHVLVEPLISFSLARASIEPWWLRLQPVLLGTACAPALFLLARRTGGEALGLLAAALAAGSLHHVEFSGVADFYPHLALGGVLSTLVLLRAVEDGGRRAFALYAAAAALFLHAHPFAAIVLALHGAWVAACRRDRLRPFLAAAAAAAALCLPWAAFVLSRARPLSLSAAGHSRPWTEAWWTLRCWSGEPERGLYAASSFRGWVLAASAVHACLAVLGAWRLRRDGRWDARWSLAALLAAGGPAAAILLDRAFAYDYMPRQSLFALPFFLLFVAEGLRTAWACRPARPAAALALLLPLVVLFRGFSGQLGRMKRRFVNVARRTEATTRPGDTLLFDEPNFAAWFLYYYDREAFLRLGRPVLRDGFYVFALPEGFTAGGGRRVSVVWDPLSGEEEERRRWADLRARIAAGSLSGPNVHLSLMRPMARLKAAEFLPSSGLSL